MASCRKVSWPLKSRCSTCFTCSFNVNHKEKWLPNWGHWSYQTKPNNALTKCKSLTSVICFHRLNLAKTSFYLKHPAETLQNICIFCKTSKMKDWGCKSPTRFSFWNQLVACFSVYPSQGVNFKLNLRHRAILTKTFHFHHLYLLGKEGNSWH